MIQTIKYDGAGLYISGEASGGTMIECGKLTVEEAVEEIGAQLHKIIKVENDYDRGAVLLPQAFSGDVKYGDKPSAEIAERLDSCEISVGAKGTASFKVKCYSETLGTAVDTAEAAAKDVAARLAEDKD